MATQTPARNRRNRRSHEIHKPNGSIHPRVQKVAPEHFGIVAVDCAKARSKWMLADFYGNVLIPPTEVNHSRPALQEAVARIRLACESHQILDLIVVVERTGRYHHVVKDAFAASGLEVRVVHPFATKQFRQPADPGNKTDDTDLSAIHRATVNGFGLTGPQPDPIHDQLKLLARHRRDLVRKSVALRCKIREHLNVFNPGYETCFADLFNGEVALTLARRLGSPKAIGEAGVAGMERILREAAVRSQSRTLQRIVAWAAQAPESPAEGPIHQRIMASLDDDRRAKLSQIDTLESDLAELLAQTPYLLLLSVPGINVVSAAEFAGEMGPIGLYATSRSITRRAGLVPSRYQSDRVDRADGPLIRQANRNLRQAILMIADNLMTCNEYFRTLSANWRAAGKDPRHSHVKVGGRFCRIAYQMVAGGRVFSHPCCQRRDYILNKLMKFHAEHETPLVQAQATLASAVEQIPGPERAVEAVPLAEELAKATTRRASGPRLIGELLPVVLARLGVNPVDLRSSGEADPR
jgi:transposase